METQDVKRQGRLTQIKVYVGKFFRIFVNERNWKTIFFAVVVAGILSLVLQDSMFVTKESTRSGFFAIVSSCIWIGIFNSIQEVCKERQVIKREHRTGLHITSYVAAHMIYQASICLVQALVMTAFYGIFLKFPSQGLITGFFCGDFFLSLFLVLYAADMLGLAVSSIVRNTTSAMTVMPFILIVQLIFSGSIFPITGHAKIISDLTISKWGQRVLCIEANLNELPSEILDSELEMLEEADDLQEILEELPEDVVQDIIRDGRSYLENFVHDYTYRKIYSYEASLVLRRWGYLALFALIYALAAVVSLEFIDRDKR